LRRRIITEYYKFKTNWEIISSNPDKLVNGKKLIDIVNNAYRNTNLGSFVKTIRDVLKSIWMVIDLKEDGIIDACIFYRTKRKDENWDGFKIQGIGHDGSDIAKKSVIKKLINILKKPKYWIEASGKLELILEQNGVPKITDINVLSKLYPNSEIVMMGDKYKRTLNNGTWITESTFGNPEINI
jgi:hypothetical protein